MFTKSKSVQREHSNEGLPFYSDLRKSEALPLLKCECSKLRHCRVYKYK